MLSIKLNSVISVIAIQCSNACIFGDAVYGNGCKIDDILPLG